MLKRFTPITILIVCCLAFFTLAARPYQDNPPQPPTPAPLSIPQSVELALTAGIGFLITNGLKSFSKTLQKNKYFKWFPDLSGLGTSTTTAVVTILILYGNTMLAGLPPEWVPVIRSVFAVIAVTVTAYGIHYTSTQNKPPELEMNTLTTLEQTSPPDNVG